MTPSISSVLNRYSYSLSVGNSSKAAIYINAPKIAIAFAGIETWNSGSMTTICWKLIISQRNCSEVDSSKLISKFSKTIPFPPDSTAATIA